MPSEAEIDKSARLQAAITAGDPAVELVPYDRFSDCYLVFRQPGTVAGAKVA